MIFYLLTKKNRHTIYNYLRSSWAREISPLIQPIEYERFLKTKSFPKGIYIFSDIELLEDTQRQKAVAIYENLKNGNLLLNHPTMTPKRYELLRGLFDKGINQFNVYRLNEDISNIRFPVFIRLADDHTGARSDLIDNHDTLKQQIQKMEATDDANRWLICEYLDTTDENGIFRKYAAFYVDGQIVSRHLFFSKKWLVKLDDLYDEDFFNEEKAYLESNPHAEKLCELFEKAHVRYGRIDYSLKDGQIQVWEINTNPVILTPFSAKRSGIRLPIQQMFAKNIAHAWQDLAQKCPEPPNLSFGQKIENKWAWCNYLFTEVPMRRLRRIRSATAEKFPFILKAYQTVRKILTPARS